MSRLMRHIRVSQPTSLHHPGPWIPGILPHRVRQSIRSVGSVPSTTGNPVATSSSTTSDTANFETQFKAARLADLRARAVPLYPRLTPTPTSDLHAEESDAMTDGFQHVMVRTLRETWDRADLPKGSRLRDVTLTLYGRIVSRRDASAKLIFLEVEENGARIQVVLSRANLQPPPESPKSERDKPTCMSSRSEAPPLSNFHDGVHRTLHRGDLIAIRGFIGKTNTGELSVFAVAPVRLLTPCLHDLPYRTGLKDHQKRYRQRYLDLLLNPDHRTCVLARATILRTLRQFLDRRGFIEVETPVLWPRAGGANARPFITHSNALGGGNGDAGSPTAAAGADGDTAPGAGNALPLQLRVAPELFLKQLVIGGLDRVYEIGKQFRNEGIDASHNPEFTTLEFYQAYTDMEGLIQLTEEILGELVAAVNTQLGRGDSQSVRVTYSKESDGEPINLDFTAPFRRLDVTKELVRAIGRPLPDFNDADSALATLRAICVEGRIPVSEPATLPRILDTLIGHYIEPLCVQPTFLYGHPTIMSPLAKANDRDPSIAQRFELFVLGKEIVNAYEELNDPKD
ncbi:hypothetical protein IWQ60_007371, partial [Tieghemiomyces parasiticus]